MLVEFAFSVDEPTIFSILATILVDVFIVCHNVYCTSGFLGLNFRYPQEK